MSRPQILIFNIETQEEIVREMNDAEYEQYLVDVAAFVTPTPPLEG